MGRFGRAERSLAKHGHLVDATDHPLALFTIRQHRAQRLLTSQGGGWQDAAGSSEGIEPLCSGQLRHTGVLPNGRKRGERRQGKPLGPRLSGSRPSS